MGWDDVDDKLFKKLIKQVTGTITEKDGELIPYHSIKGNGIIWCYHITTKSLIPVARGMRLYILEPVKNEHEKKLVYTESGRLILIDQQEIEEIGFN